jgi:hypothetical protein
MLSRHRINATRSMQHQRPPLGLPHRCVGRITLAERTVSRVASRTRMGGEGGSRANARLGRGGGMGRRGHVSRRRRYWNWLDRASHSWGGLHWGETEREGRERVGGADSGGMFDSISHCLIAFPRPVSRQSWPFLKQPHTTNVFLTFPLLHFHYVTLLILPIPASLALRTFSGPARLSMRILCAVAWHHGSSVSD